METKTPTAVKLDVNTESEAPADVASKRTSTKEIIAYLAEKFPACFSVQGPAKPLKVGIFQELADKLSDDQTVSKTRLRQALRHYTSSWRYLKAVKLNSFRVDIDGKNASEVDQEQADYAAKILKESQENYAKKHPKATANQKPSAGNKQSKGKGAVKSKAVAGKQQTHKSSEKQKYKGIKSTKRAESKVEAKLIPVESSNVAVGKAVKVKLGNSPMEAIITEVSGNDISVQLSSGMVIKTQVSHIFTQ
jgi:ProP effector